MKTISGGATLTELDVDVVERRLRMSAQAVNLSEASQLVLVLHGVSRLNIDRPDDTTWDFAEITEVHVKQDAGAFEVQLVLWVETNGISATCESVEVLSLSPPDCPRTPGGGVTQRWARGRRSVRRLAVFRIGRPQRANGG